MAAKAEAIITAGLRPELFEGRGILASSKSLIIAGLVVLVLAGFGFRVSALNAEGLSEDELNKLNAVAEYRTHGLTGVNGEHPFFMKALQLVSIVAAERWNELSFVASHPSQAISSETALRLPGTILGSLTAVLIYLVAAELFGAEVALIAAALWTLDPTAIGFARIAKEDSFLLFFFLLANVFWLRGQRVAESTDRNPNPYYWATAASYGAMVASKYVPYLLCISISYYWIFQQLPETRWRLGKKKMLLFFTIMGVTFLILSPTILLPETWRQMGLFASNKLIGHDGYEFMGKLYNHRFEDWVKGLPPYFYLAFTFVKLPMLTLGGLLIGLPLLFRRKLGDGRYFILMWLFFWFFGFSFLGGKFTRYFTTALPALLVTSALGIQFAGRWIQEKLPSSNGLKHYVPATLAIVVISMAAVNSVQASPHFRLFMNVVGGGTSQAGYYFPHDEFYDASIRDAVKEIARRATPDSHVVSESPSVATYYAEQFNRKDLICVSLSDPQALKQLRVGDFLIVARGRRYFTNDATLKALANISPAWELRLGTVPAGRVYVLDTRTLNLVQANAPLSATPTERR